MKRQSIVLFIIISLVGCWTAPVPPPPVGQSVVHKTSRPSPTFKSNRAAILQIKYHLIDTTSSGIYAGAYGGTGLVVGPRNIIAVGWHSSNITLPIILGWVTVESLSGGWSDYASITGRFGGKSGDEIALLRTDDELPVRPAVFSRADAARKIKGYRFGSDGSTEFFDLNKVVPVFVLPSDNPQCDIVNRINTIDTFSADESTFDMDHQLVCYADRPWWEVQNGLARFGVVTITK